MIGTVEKDLIDELQKDWALERPDLDARPMGVVLRIQALAKILGDQAAERLQEFGLQWWQYDVLSALRRQGMPFVMPATQLAETAMLTSGAMTNRIDRLETEGLVRRLEDKEDRRRVLVQLTRKGHKLVEKASEARFEAATGALRNLTSVQRRRLSDLLRLVMMSQAGSGEA
jgi:DNA-binding MarR family transcriptional regulator